MSNVSTGQEAEITADLPRERSQFKAAKPAVPVNQL